MTISLLNRLRGSKGRAHAVSILAAHGCPGLAFYQPAVRWRMPVMLAVTMALMSVMSGRSLAQSPPVVIKTVWGPQHRLPAKPPNAVLREVAQDTLEIATPATTRKGTGPSPSSTSKPIASDVGAPIRSPAGTHKPTGPSPGSASKPVPSVAGPAAIFNPRHSLYLPEVRGVDPMVAAGRDYLIVSQQGEMVFLDKNGARLPAKDGVPGHVGVDDVFGAFTQPGGPYDINQHAGFPGPCDAAQYPDTRGRKFCVSEFYDLRTYFDAGADRFVLVAAMRNPVWTEIWREGWKVYTDEFGSCGTYASPANIGKPLPDPTFCDLARRYQVFAVSKTEDPREGFHIYAMTENNYRDWPWATVNAEGNAFVLGARGTEMDQGPALSVFSLEDLRAGSEAPRFYKLYPKDLGTIGRRVAPIMHHGASQGLGGRTLAVSRADSRTLEIFALSGPTGHGTVPPFGKTSVTLPAGVWLHDWLGAAVYRNGSFHATWSAKPSGIAEPGIWNLRIPITISEGSVVAPPLSASTPGYRYRLVGKEGLENAVYPDFAPAIAVSGDGDVMTSYVRRLSTSQLQVRYVLWQSGADTPEPGVAIHVGGEDFTSEKPKIDYAWAVVDPVDDRTFWFAQNYRWWSQAGDNTALVRIRPD